MRLIWSNCALYNNPGDPIALVGAALSSEFEMAFDKIVRGSGSTGPWLESAWDGMGWDGMGWDGMGW